MKKIIIISMLGIAAMILAAHEIFAADTYTPYYNLRLPDLDIEDEETPWGEKYNNNFSLIDSGLQSLKTSTSSLTSDVAALKVSTGAIQAQLNAVAVSTGALYNEKLAKAGDTMTGQLTMDRSSITWTNGGSIENVNRVLLNTSFSDGCTEGAIQWNMEDGTAEICMQSGQIQLQIGQELLFKAKMVGTAGLNGQVVAITGASGQRPEIELADADAANVRLQDCVIGVLTEDVNQNANGFFNAYGYVRDINTSAFSDGDKVYLDTTAGGLTKTIPAYPAKVIPVGVVVYAHATEGILFVHIMNVPSQIVVSSVTAAAYYGDISGTEGINVTHDETYGYLKDPTGFIEEGISGSSLTLSGLTFTISGSSFPIYIDGYKLLKSTGSVTLPNTTQTNWIYYNAAGSLTQSTSFPGFDQALVASVYYSTRMVYGLIGDERHGAYMDWRTHEYVHETIGARYASGMSGTFTTASSTITAGEFYDDDHEISTPQSNRFTVLYKNGSSFFDFTRSTTAVYQQTAGVLQYNNGTALASVPSGSYAAYWIFATPFTNEPYVIVTGQRVDATIADARTNNTLSNLSLTGFPTPELKPIYRLIFRNVAGTITYIENADYRSVSELPGANYVPTLHSSLSGLDLTSAAHPYDTAGGFASYDAMIASDSLKVSKAGDTMTGPLTLINTPLTVSGSSLTVTGVSSGYSIETSTSVKVIGNVLFNGNNGSYVGFGTNHVAFNNSSDYVYVNTLGVERMRINATGVGIGAVPSETLTVSGGSILLDNQTGTLKWKDSGGTARSLVYLSNANNLMVGKAVTSSVQDVDFDKMIIKGATGNIGIGTASPVQKLEVAGNLLISTGAVNIGSNAQAIFTAQTSGSSGNNAALRLIGGTANADWYIGTNRADLAGSGDSLMLYKAAGTAGAKMVISDSGSVGIGSTTPTVPLVVKGTSNNNTDQVIIDNLSDSNSKLHLGSFANDGYIFNNYRYRSGHTSDSPLYGAAGIILSSNTLTLQTAPAPATTRVSVMTLNGSNIGIGNNNPSSKLHCSTCVITVDGTGANIIVQPEDTYPALISLRKNAGTTSSFAAFRGENAAGAALGYIGFGYDTDSTGIDKYQDGFLWLTQANGNLHFGTNNTERLTIKDSGNIGIGDAAPTAKLVVNGNIVSSGTIYAQNGFYGSGVNLSGVGALVSSVTVSVATGTITFSGLDGNSAGVYYMVFASSTATGGMGYRLNFNGDTTSTNYVNAQTNNNGSGVGASSDNSDKLFASAIALGTPMDADGHIKIYRGGNGHIFATGDAVFSDGTSGIWTQNARLVHHSAQTNITSISFLVNNNGFPVGTRVELYRSR